MNASILIIGDEILSGNTLDTNSNFIASELKNIGISVSRIFTVPDQIETIKNGLKSATEISEIVITTGGIGPTKDDKTRAAFAEFFNDKLVLDDSVFAGLTAGSDLTNFVSSSNPAATSAAATVLYNTSTGALYYDADGNGAGAAVQFATLSGHPTLLATDFIIL